MNHINTKMKQLTEMLRSFGSVAVAFSGGVDSSFLAKVPVGAIGDKAIAVTALSETLAKREKQETIQIATEIGIEHILLTLSELNSPEFVENTVSRCYHCKKERFSILATWAQDNGYSWVLEGSNADDLSDYRPGMQAVKELEKVEPTHALSASALLMPCVTNDDQQNAQYINLQILKKTHNLFYLDRNAHIDNHLSICNEDLSLIFHLKQCSLNLFQLLCFY